MKDIFSKYMDSICITIGVAIVVLCFTIGSIVNHSKDVELEKYKIQMSVYGEEIPEEN